MSTDKKTFSPGHIINGKYRLENLIAIGGMGEVYKAIQLNGNRTVAIKTLRKEYLTDKETSTRFVREAKAASVVKHSNIVEIIDVDRTDIGIPFIVQEYLEGRTLAQLVRKAGDGLPAKRVVEIMIPVLDAIGEAHAKGVVHRDIKPSNVLLTRGRGGALIAKILDFGISKIVNESDDARLTKTTAMLGSPAYMSPEQIRSPGDVTPRSDVWSIGALLYEALTGQLPFMADQASAIMIKICTEEPISLSQAVPGISTELVAVVSRCLRKQPEERFSDARELAHTLRQIFKDLDRGDAGEGNAHQPNFGSRDEHGNTTTLSAPRLRDKLDISDDKSKKPKFTEMYVEQSSADMTSIVGAFVILSLVLLINTHFTTYKDFNDFETLALADYFLQLIMVGMLYACVVLIHKHGGNFSEIGINFAMIGLYGIGAGIVILSICQYVAVRDFLQFSPRIISSSAAVTTIGFALAGIQACKDDLSTHPPHVLPGIFSGLLSLIAVLICLQLVYQTFS